MGRTREWRRRASLRENTRWYNGRIHAQSDGANCAGRREARLHVSLRSCGAGPTKKERTAKHASSRCDPRLYSRCARQCCRVAGIVRRRLLRCCCCYRWASSYISIGVGGGGSIRATIPYQSTVRGTCAPLPLWTDCLLEPRPRCTATSVAHTLTPRRARCCEMSSYRGTSVAPPCDHRNIPAHTLIPRPSTTPPDAERVYPRYTLALQLRATTATLIVRTPILRHFVIRKVFLLEPH